MTRTVLAQEGDASSRRTTGPFAGMAPWLLCLAAIVLTLPWANAIPQAWGNPRMLLGGDDRWDYWLPSSFFLDTCVHHGEFPLWNPLVLCGVPFAASPLSAAFYPPNLLRSLMVFDPTPFKTNLSLFAYAAFHLAMGGLATFALARRHGLSVAASLTAMFGFIYCQPLSAGFWTQMNVLATVTWLPVILVALNHGICAERSSQRLCFGLLAGLSFGTALLIGSPEHALYVALFVGSYAVLFPLLGAAASGAWGRTRLQAVTQAVAIVALAFATAAIIATVLFLPAAELIRFSMRNTRAYMDMASRMNLVSTTNAGMLLLVVAGFTHPRKRDLALFAALAVLFLCCALGPPFPVATALRACAPWQLGTPMRAARYGTFALSMLAGFGVDALAGSAVPKCRSRAWSLLLLVLGAGLTVALLQGDRFADRALFLSGASSAVWAFVPLVVVVMLARWLPAYRRVWLIAIPLLVLGELGIWNDHLYRAAFKVYPFPGDLESLRDAPSGLSRANHRAVATAVNSLMFQLRCSVTGYEPAMLSDTWKMLCRPGMEAQYEKRVWPNDCTAANPHGNLLLKRLFWLTTQYVSGSPPPKSCLFPPTTTVFLENASELPVKRVRKEDVVLESVSQSRSGVDLSGQHPQTQRIKSGLGGFQTTLGPLELPAQHCALRIECRARGNVVVESELFDPTTTETSFGRTVALTAADTTSFLADVPLPDFKELVANVTVRYGETDSTLEIGDIYIVKDDADLGARLRITEQRANSVEVAVSGPQESTVLTFVQAAYPGWRAYVDGREVKIWRANKAFQAVVVPPGDHLVRFVFRPVRVYIGGMVSLFALLAASGVAIAAWRHSGRAASPACERDRP